MANTSQAAPGSREVQTSLTDKERAQVQRLFSDPTELPPIFKNWITSWTEQDVALALTQIQGWSDFLNSQTATDASQASSIASNASGISSLNSTTASQASQIAALQSVDTTQNSTLATHTTQIAAGATLDTTQNGRLTVLEAHPIPHIIATDFTPATVSGTTVETQLTSLTLPANTLPVPGVCEFRANGTWTDSTSQTIHAPVFNLYFSTSLVATNNIGPLGLSVGPGTVFSWDVEARFTNTTSISVNEVVFKFFTASTEGATANRDYFVNRSAPNMSTASSRAFVLKSINTNSTISLTCNSATLTLLAGS